MFGISLQKLLVLAGALIAVWGFFNWAARQKKLRDRKEREAAEIRAGRAAEARRTGPTRETAAPAVEEMKTCKICGAYVASGAKGCGKPACPYL